MSTQFRLWFILEITMYSFPVVIGAVVTCLTLSVEAPFHVRIFQIAFIICCCLSVKSVWQMMQFLFHEKEIDKPKLTFSFILVWMLIWIYSGIISASSNGLILAFSLPVVVVLHMYYLVNKASNNNT